MWKNFLKLFFYRFFCPSCVLCEKDLFIDEKRVCHGCLMKLCQLHIEEGFFTFSYESWRFIKQIKDKKIQRLSFEALLILAFDAMEEKEFIYFHQATSMKSFEAYFLAKKGHDLLSIVDQHVWVFTDQPSIEMQSFYKCSLAASVSIFWLKGF